MIDLNQTLFIVDGLTEIGALRVKFQCDYGKSPDIRLVNCNGKDVKPQGYANAAKGVLLLAMKGRYTLIIFLIDREKRTRDVNQFRNDIKKALIDGILPGSRYHQEELERKIQICVPDRMFENWIVSDIDGIKDKHDFIVEAATQDFFDGKSGTSTLKHIMAIPYKKTQHGPKLFNSTRFDISKDNSPSFKRFYEKLELP